MRHALIAYNERLTRWTITIAKLCQRNIFVEFFGVSHMSANGTKIKQFRRVRMVMKALTFNNQLK